METKCITIQVPDGYEIDEEKSTFEEIVFKKKVDRPKTWKDYIDSVKNKERYIIHNGDTYKITTPYHSYFHYEKYSLPTKELAESFCAMIQLMSLRQAWIGDWTPDYYDNDVFSVVHINDFYCVKRSKIDPKVPVFETGTAHPLSFPTQEMAIDFKDTFYVLIQKAKDLI